MTVAIAAFVLAIPAWIARAPLLSPPFGASIWLCIRGRGLPPAAPRRVFVSHVVAVLCGNLGRWLSGTAAVGLAHLDSDFSIYVAAIIALVSTTFVLEAIDGFHPPAAASTLVVSLGVLATPAAHLAMVAAAALLALLCFLNERMAPRIVVPGAEAHARPEGGA